MWIQNTDKSDLWDIFFVKFIHIPPNISKQYNVFIPWALGIGQIEKEDPVRILFEL